MGPGAGIAYSFTYFQNKYFYYRLSDTLYSTDGLNWTQDTTKIKPHGAADSMYNYGAASYTAISNDNPDVLFSGYKGATNANDGYCYSFDGLTWTTVSGLGVYYNYIISNPFG